MKNTNPVTQTRIPTLGVAALLFVFTLVVYWASPVITVTDSLWNLYVSASILQEGNADLDEYQHLIDLEDDIRVISSGGHYYSYYPIATPLISAPFVWAANIYFSLRNSEGFFAYLDRHKPDEVTGRLEKNIASVISAINAAVVFLIGSWSFLNRRQAVFLSLIFAFSTSMWSTASRAMWQHGPSALFLSIAILLVTLAKKNEKFISYTGLTLAIAYIIRPTNSLSVIFISLYVLVNHRRYFLHYLMSAGMVAIPYIYSNWMMYGTMLPRYSFQLFEKLSPPERFLEALAGTMISPARGVFVFTPLFLFSIFGTILSIKRGSFTAYNLQPYAAAIIIGHWLIISSFYDWDGSWSIGPRYFVDIIPYFIYLLIPVFQNIDGFFSRSIWKYSFITLVVISTLIQFRCATSIYPFLWNRYPVTYPDGATYRDWDWTDLQVLRGFCPGDPEKGQAPACWIN